MTDLHDMTDTRPAPRTASPLVLWLLCAVAFGGAWLLHSGLSTMAPMPMAAATSAAVAKGSAGTKAAIAPAPRLVATASTN